MITSASSSSRYVPNSIFEIGRHERVRAFGNVDAVQLLGDDVDEAQAATKGLVEGGFAELAFELQPGLFYASAEGE